MLVIYEAIDGSYVQRGREEHCHPVWEDNLPVVSQVTSMGAEIPWVVLEVQPYQNVLSERVYVAMVHPQDIAIPARDCWYGVRSRLNYPDISFNIQFANDLRFLQLGMHMDGKAPVGRLANAELISDSTQARTIPSVWKIDQIDVYWPINAAATYTKIHLGWCIQEAETLVAV
jgi:hypothetical protein